MLSLTQQDHKASADDQPSDLNLSGLSGGIINISLANDRVDVPEEIPDSPNKSDPHNIDMNGIQNDPNASFVMDFSDGYSLRTLMNFLKSINKEIATFYLTSSGILYCNKNDAGNILSNINIFAHNLIRYEFQSQTGICIININLVTLAAKLTKVTKNLSFRMYKTPDTPYIFYQYFTDRANVNDDNVGFIPLEPIIAQPNYNLPTYSNENGRPNCVISTSDINSLCKELSDKSCKKIRLWVFPLGLHISIVSNATHEFFSRKFGEVDEAASITATPSLNRLPMTNSGGPMPSTISRIRVKPRNLVEEFFFYPAFFQNLDKLTNINPRGVAKFYAETGNALKIVTSVGDYGQMSLYINKA